MLGAGIVCSWSRRFYAGGVSCMRTRMNLGSVFCSAGHCICAGRTHLARSPARSSWCAAAATARHLPCQAHRLDYLQLLGTSTLHLPRPRRCVSHFLFCSCRLQPRPRRTMCCSGSLTSCSISGRMCVLWLLCRARG